MQRRKFSREFKIEAVRLVGERDVSVAQASRDIDVHENVLRRRFPGTVRCAVAKLKAERDILKRAAAYFARELT